VLTILNNLIMLAGDLRIFYCQTHFELIALLECQWFTGVVDFMSDTVKIDVNLCAFYVYIRVVQCCFDNYSVFEQLQSLMQTKPPSTICQQQCSCLSWCPVLSFRVAL